MPLMATWGAKSSMPRRARENPAVDEIQVGVWRRHGQRVLAELVHDQPGRVPHLVGEALEAFDAALVEAHVLAGHRHRSAPGPERISAVAANDLSWVDGVALGLAHPLAVSGLHHAV